MSLLCNRAWSSSRDIVAYLKGASSQVEEQLKSGNYQCFIELNEGISKTISECVQFLQQPPVNTDVFRMLEATSAAFDRRVGLTELAYGLNPGGVASRSAADINAKQESLSVRPDYMAGKVEDWMTECANIEKFVARWHVSGQDVAPLLGKVGAMLWDELIVSEDPEICVREMKATVEAGSSRKPNRQRDSANLNQAIGWVLPVLQQYATVTGDSQPINAYFEKWGEAADMDMSGLVMGEWKPKPPEPDPMMIEQQQKMEEAQARREQVEMQLKEMDVAAKQMDVEAKQVDLQTKLAALQGSGMDAQVEAERQVMDLEYERTKQEQDLMFREALNQLNLDARQMDAVIKLQSARDLARMKHAQVSNRQ